MEQHITKFEKPMPRLLAYVFVGVGLIGTGLFLGGDVLGISALNTAASFLTLIGFVVGGVFVALNGTSPVATGTTAISMSGGGGSSQTEIEVKMSDELTGHLKKSLDAAVRKMESDNQKVIEAAQATLEKTQNELSNLKALESIAKLDIRTMVKDLQNMQGSVDLDSLNDAISSIKGGARTVSNNLDELSNLSTAQLHKIEEKLAEFSENIVEANKQLQVTIKQFESFNAI